MILWLALAVAHGPEKCPALPTLEGLVRDGRLPEALLGCVDGHGLETPEGRAYRYLAWRDALAREGATEEALAGGGALLDAGLDPARALSMAEATATVAPELAARAWSVAESGATPSDLERLLAVDAAIRPEGAVERRARALAGLGLTGPTLDAACAQAPGACEAAAPWPLPERPAAAAVELRQCLDVGRMYAKAWLGRAYETDLDCLARALDGAERPVTARLAAVVALGYRTPSLVVAHRAAAEAPSDPWLAWRLGVAHAAAGDARGERAWKERARALSPADSR